MGKVFYVTHPIDTVANQPASQSLDDVVDVSEFDEIFVWVQLCSVNNSTGSLTFNLVSGFSRCDVVTGVLPSDWITLSTDTWSSENAQIHQFSKGGFLRYLGWKISSNTMNGAAFIVAGVGRTYAPRDNR